MIGNIHIQGFRCFEDFKVEKFGRINLLVGKNNSGKTALMQALFLLSSRGNPESWSSFLGSTMLPYTSPGNGAEQQRARVRGLFYDKGSASGDELSVKSDSVRTAASQGFWAEEVTLRLKDEPVPTKIAEATFVNQPHPAFECVFTASQPAFSSRFAIPLFNLADLNGPYVIGDAPLPRRGAFIASRHIEATLVLEAFKWVGRDLSRIEAVVSFLKCADPSVSDLRAIPIPEAVNGTSWLPASWDKKISSDMSRGYLTLIRDREGEPMNRVGEGMWRLLSVAVALAGSQGLEHFFIDEIETGLHHSIVQNMLRVLIDFSVKHRVQMFLSTHSEDVVRALAAIAAERIELGEDPDEIFAHRIQDRRQADGTMRKLCVSASGTELSAIVGRELEFR